MLFYPLKALQISVWFNHTKEPVILYLINNHMSFSPISTVPYCSSPSYILNIETLNPLWAVSILRSHGRALLALAKSRIKIKNNKAFAIWAFESNELCENNIVSLTIYLILFLCQKESPFEEPLQSQFHLVTRIFSCVTLLDTYTFNVDRAHPLPLFFVEFQTIFQTIHLQNQSRTLNVRLLECIAIRGITLCIFRIGL